MTGNVHDTDRRRWPRTTEASYHARSSEYRHPDGFSVLRSHLDRLPGITEGTCKAYCGCADVSTARIHNRREGPQVYMEEDITTTSIEVAESGDLWTIYI